MTAAEKLPDEECVVLYFKLADAAFGTPFERTRWAVLESVLRAVLAATKRGEVDGHEVGEGFLKIFIYGPNAKAIWRVASLQVALWFPPKDSFVELRPEDGDTTRIPLR